MSNLDLSRIQPLAPGGLGTVAVETGTFRGETTRLLAAHFPNVITLELSDALHGAARRALSDLSHVQCLRGSSADLLPSLLAGLPPQETVFFFLDAHWSGDHTVDWQRSAWKGYGTDTAHLSATHHPSSRDQVPLAEELAAIMAYCRGPAHILIDDMKNLPAEGTGKKNFSFQGEDWSHLSREMIRGIARPRLLRSEELKKPAQWFLSLRAL